MPKITIELDPKKHRHYWDAKLDRGEKSLQSLMIRATDEMLLRDSAPPLPKESVTSGALPPTITAEPARDNFDESEAPWVRRTLRVIRSMKPGLAVALKFNLLQFEEAAIHWDAEHGSVPGQRAGRAKGKLRITHEAVAALEQLEGEIAEGLARLRPNDSGDGEGEERTPRKRR